MPDWWITKDGDAQCLALYQRHYSRYTYKDGRDVRLFVGPGEKLVLRTWECDALFVWRRFKDDSGQQGINCAIFRNESKLRSSDLIRQADAIADHCWPSVRHYTYVNALRIKSKNPGFCFKAAGWRMCGTTKSGLIILDKPAMTTTQDPYESEEYQRFVASMVPHCHCRESNRPCDGVLAGGVCDNIQDEKESYE